MGAGSTRWRPRSASTGLALAVAALALAGCTEVESSSEVVYEPAKLTEVKGEDELKLVTFTAEGAKRVGLEIAQVERNGKGKVIPYESMLYDAEGKTHVYTSPKPLDFLREEVEVDRITGDRVYLKDGPPAGTDIVTTGVVEVYGTELEINDH